MASHLIIWPLRSLAVPGLHTLNNDITKLDWTSLGLWFALLSDVTQHCSKVHEESFNRLNGLKCVRLQLRCCFVCDEWMRHKGTEI
ncbi:hypothetical protein AVEN_68405-1 [Araneus ventricosus]|uniref:Uncharacterized protein n=1 Tax=Araneus ventricosus TaxID=182803 RepID=A0A4Y2H7B9_ARAVE|nr:hypothetical protein AVEN_68405-1 [Araneus ventricosus]